MSRWFACAALAGSLALSACATAVPATAGDPMPRFASPADATRHAGHGAPVRVRRDAHGRPIYFREQRVDRNGVMRDVEHVDIDPQTGEAQSRERDADCDGRVDCRSDNDGGDGRDGQWRGDDQ